MLMLGYTPNNMCSFIQCEDTIPRGVLIGWPKTDHSCEEPVLATLFLLPTLHHYSTLAFQGLKIAKKPILSNSVF